jgi:hypothetical protein
MATTVPTAASDAVVAPRLAELVRHELRRELRPPFTAPSVVLVNGALMTGAWFLLPTTWQDALFRLHGPFAFAIILSSWMYADVPATNVLGNGARESLAALDHPPDLRRLLNARNIVLWLFVTPICLAVAIGIGIYEARLTPTLLTVVAIVFPPFGALGIAAWIGIRFPYHPIALAQRWRQRGRWRHMWARWLILVTIPYVAVPWLAGLTALPAFAFWSATGDGLSGRLGDARFAIGVLLAATSSLLLWYVGRRVSVRLVRKRGEELRSYLAEPSLG